VLLVGGWSLRESGTARCVDGCGLFSLPAAIGPDSGPMKVPALEVADILRIPARLNLEAVEHTARIENVQVFGPREEIKRLSFRSEKRALTEIPVCRTAALGGYVEECDHCGHRNIAYRSCRNRHCPKCQAAARAAWLEQRAAELLPVEYFHVVFTLPQPLAPLALQNQRVLYGILFRAASETLFSSAPATSQCELKVRPAA
jgi:hypothetical protein